MRKEWLLVLVVVIVMLSEAPPTSNWNFRTHGATYGSRGIAKVAFDQLVANAGNLKWDLVRVGSGAPDTWRQDPYYMDSGHTMTYVENQGGEWLMLANGAQAVGAWDNVAYYLGIASHYWADLTCYAHHDNARIYYENLYGKDIGYDIWYEYHHHLEIQVKYYRPKDPALIIQGGGGGSTNYTYVTGETVNAGGATGYTSATCDDGTYENIYEINYGGAAGGPENRAVDLKDVADDTTDALADAQSDDQTGASPSAVVSGDGWYTVDKDFRGHFDSINTSGMSGSLTLAKLWVQFSVEAGYSNPGTAIEWATDESTFNSTGIVPVNGNVDRTESYNLLAQGVDTIAELEALDVRFINNEAAPADAVSFDYVRVEATWAGEDAYRENVRHDITGILAADTYALQIEYYTTGDAEGVTVYLLNNGATWDIIGSLQGGSAGGPITFSYDIDANHISGGAVSVRYVQSNNDATQTSLMVDYCRVMGQTGGGPGGEYASLSAFLLDEHTQLSQFIDYVCPPGGTLGGWFGDWIKSRKIEASDYSVYANGNANNVHYGSKELVDMATELIYSGWVYSLGIGDSVSTQRITWDQWWSREHRKPGITFYYGVTVSAY